MSQRGGANLPLVTTPAMFSAGHAAPVTAMRPEDPTMLSSPTRSGRSPLSPTAVSSRYNGTWGHVLRGPGVSADSGDPPESCSESSKPSKPPANHVFMDLLREHGNGSVAIAWRRHFDKDGLGELTFQEFCAALATLGYREDALDLWHKLDGDGSLCLERLDPSAARLLDEFRKWCLHSSGGAMKVFDAADLTRSGTLGRRELVSGLRWLGLFDDSSLPETLNSEDAFLAHLYPLLDPWDSGSISRHNFCILEAEQWKQCRRYKYRLSKRATKPKQPPTISSEVVSPKAKNSALNLLSSISKTSRIVGQNVDALLSKPAPDEAEALARHPRERNKKRKQLLPRRSASTPELSSRSPPPLASQDAAETAAAVMAEVSGARGMPPSISLPRLAAGLRQSTRSGAASHSGRDTAESEVSYQCSVAASSVVATRKGMRRLYKTKQVDKLPALPALKASEQDRDLRNIMSGVACHRQRMSAAAKSKRCGDFLSQQYEQAIFDRYYN